MAPAGLALLLAAAAAAAAAAATMGVAAFDNYRPEARRVAIELHGDGDAKRVAAEHGYELLGKIETLDSHYVLQEPAHGRDEEKHAHVSEHPHVLWWQEQKARRLMHRVQRVAVADADADERYNNAAAKRSASNAPRDPTYGTQWHLHSSVDVNVEAVWAMGVNGTGVTVCVIDDGLQKVHPDLADNYVDEGSYDFNGNDRDVTPSPRYDDHGTSAAGACCAVNNMALEKNARNRHPPASFCGVGTAWGAKVSGVRLIAAATEDWQEARGIGYYTHKNDVFSASWGPPDDGKRLEGPGPLAAAARAVALRSGRGGRGAVYVWAAGNGRSKGDNCNYDGWANDVGALTIGAVTNSGRQPWYSEDCASMFGVAPSSGGRAAIATTDLLGHWGTSNSDCTTSFGGTSASAPIGAGIAALVLSARPTLHWRDVQGVFVESGRKIDTSDRSWQRNGAGHDVSVKYGFGLLNAALAVTTARHWMPYRNVSVVRSAAQRVNRALTKSTHMELEWTCSADDCGSRRLQHVELDLWAVTRQRGTLAVELRSPSGTRSYLASHRADTNADIPNWRFVTTMNWGEPAAGTWKLVLQTSASSPGGSVKSFTVHLHTYTCGGLDDSCEPPADPDAPEGGDGGSDGDGDGDGDGDHDHDHDGNNGEGTGEGKGEGKGEGSGEQRKRAAAPALAVPRDSQRRRKRDLAYASLMADFANAGDDWLGSKAAAAAAAAAADAVATVAK